MHKQRNFAPVNLCSNMCCVVQLQKRTETEDKKTHWAKKQGKKRKIGPTWNAAERRFVEEHWGEVTDAGSFRQSDLAVRSLKRRIPSWPAWWTLEPLETAVLPSPFAGRLHMHHIMLIESSKVFLLSWASLCHNGWGALLLRLFWKHNIPALDNKTAIWPKNCLQKKKRT